MLISGIKEIQRKLLNLVSDSFEGESLGIAWSMAEGPPITIKDTYSVRHSTCVISLINVTTPLKKVEQIKIVM